MSKRLGRKQQQSNIWRVDGIAADAVEAARAAADQEGVTLEDWLSRLVRDTAAREAAAREIANREAVQATLPRAER